jgi:hypothetical protein
LELLLVAGATGCMFYNIPRVWCDSSLSKEIMMYVEFLLSRGGIDLRKPCRFCIYFGIIIVAGENKMMMTTIT